MKRSLYSIVSIFDILTYWDIVPTHSIRRMFLFSLACYTPDLTLVHEFTYLISKSWHTKDRLWVIVIDDLDEFFACKLPTCTQIGHVRRRGLGWHIWLIKKSLIYMTLWLGVSDRHYGTSGTVCALRFENVDYRPGYGILEHRLMMILSSHVWN